MIEKLKQMASSAELVEFEQQYPFVGDAREEFISSWVDYYTDDLLGYEPFVREFSLEEINAIRKFVTDLDKLGKDNWDAIQDKAANLLRLLLKTGVNS